MPRLTMASAPAPVTRSPNRRISPARGRTMPAMLSTRISKNNTIEYEKIAEARLAYGGRGQLTEIQQPAYGQQLYDLVVPF